MSSGSQLRLFDGFMEKDERTMMRHFIINAPGIGEHELKGGRL
jgi:hypothetical protein